MAATNDGADETKRAPAAAKEKMREALDRKKETERPAAPGGSHTGAIHGSEVAGAEGKKMFRRKTG